MSHTLMKHRPTHKASASKQSKHSHCCCFTQKKKKKSSKQTNDSRMQLDNNESFKWRNKPQKKHPKRNANKFTSHNHCWWIFLLVCALSSQFRAFFWPTHRTNRKVSAGRSGKTVKAANRKQHLKWQLKSGESPLGGTRTNTHTHKMYAILFFLSNSRACVCVCDSNT